MRTGKKKKQKQWNLWLRKINATEAENESDLCEAKKKSLQGERGHGDRGKRKMITKYDYQAQY